MKIMEQNLSIDATLPLLSNGAGVALANLTPRGCPADATALKHALCQNGRGQQDQWLAADTRVDGVSMRTLLVRQISK
ncbi:MAG: hypothetical protein U1F35_17900 [Steroidobacteraceae bacterium]